ncbi:hypothetical protein PG990_014719 [Apiospora arundinis]
MRSSQTGEAVRADAGAWRIVVGGSYQLGTGCVVFRPLLAIPQFPDDEHNRNEETHAAYTVIVAMAAFDMGAGPPPPPPLLPPFSAIPLAGTAVPSGLCCRTVDDGAPAVLPEAMVPVGITELTKVVEDITEVAITGCAVGPVAGEVVMAAVGFVPVAVTPGGGCVAVGAAPGANVVFVGEAELATESGEPGDERGPRSSLSRSRISMRRASAMSCPRRKPRLD